MRNPQFNGGLNKGILEKVENSFFETGTFFSDNKSLFDTN